MTKLEEQELYYDKMLDHILSLDESAQMAFLDKLDEATSDKVMERMIRRTNKTLRKMTEGLRKVRSEVSKKESPKKGAFLKKSAICLKDIESFQNTYVKAWDELVTKAKEDTLGTSDVNQITSKDLKQLQKDAKNQVKDQAIEM